MGVQSRLKRHEIAPPAMPEVQECFCWRLDGELVDFYSSKGAVRLCMGKEGGEVLKATLRKAGAGEAPTHWGWFDHVSGRFEMVFESREVLEVCFPHGSAVAIERGQGAVVPLVATDGGPAD